ncbi:MAG: hypothetical protein ACI9SE_000926 [Neolewinella sp.]|jgi:hypothetical protein
MSGRVLSVDAAEPVVSVNSIALVEHYNQDRPHQSLDNNLIQPRPGDPATEGKIVVDERLGGLLCSYRRSA